MNVILLAGWINKTKWVSMVTGGEISKAKRSNKSERGDPYEGSADRQRACAVSRFACACVFLSLSRFHPFFVSPVLRAKSTFILCPLARISTPFLMSITVVIVHEAKAL